METLAIILSLVIIVLLACFIVYLNDLKNLMKYIAMLLEENAFEEHTHKIFKEHPKMATRQEVDVIMKGWGI